MISSKTTQLIRRKPYNIATINSELVYVLDVDTHHGVDRSIGIATARVLLPAYTDTELHYRWLNKPIEIQTGYEETGGAQRIFYGRVDTIEREWGEGGTTARIRCKGWASILDFPSETDQVFSGNSRLQDVIRALCEIRGVPMYGGDDILAEDGVTFVRLGGVAEIDEGKVIVPKRSSWLQWIERSTRIVGHRAYDRPDGFFWWNRISGQPDGDAVMEFEQARNVISIGRTDTVEDVVTWSDIYGARYEDVDGIQVQVRSFPAVVPDFPYDAPPAFVRREISSDLLVNQALADTARAASEADLAGPNQTNYWSFMGENTVQPGEIISLTAPALELEDAKRYVMSVDHLSSGSGYRTSWTAWSGSGTPVAGGNDILDIPITTGPIHVGDEYLWHYDQPSPTGKVVQFDITVPDTYTALWIEGWAHGVNSYLLGGVNTDSEASKIETWQGDAERAVGTGTLPVMPENLASRFNYGVLPPTSSHKWIRFRIPIPGRYEPGVVKIKLLSGEDKRIGAAFRWDDFEVYDVVAKFSGIGYPELPVGELG